MKRPLFNGERLVVFGLVEPSNTCTNGVVTLNGIGPDGETRKYQLNVQLDQAKPGSALNKLAAKKLIK